MVELPSLHEIKYHSVWHSISSNCFRFDIPINTNIFQCCMDHHPENCDGPPYVGVKELQLGVKKA